MKIETKFNVGDRVVVLLTKEKATVESITIEHERNKTSIRYYIKCDGDSADSIFRCYSESVLETVPKEVLDKQEKEYLSAVIKPFRNKIESICKVSRNPATFQEFIDILLLTERIQLPFFQSGTMYKGMEANKKYNLEELNL